MEWRVGVQTLTTGAQTLCQCGSWAVWHQKQRHPPALSLDRPQEVWLEVEVRAWGGC